LAISQFLVSLDISIDANYGFVKALRKLNSCSPKRVTSDSISLFIHADFEGDAESILECLRGLAGLASIDVKLCLELPEDPKKLRGLLKELGFNIVPQPLAQRIVAYREISKGSHLILEKTSKPSLYLARLARVSRISLPMPHSMFLLSGEVNEAIERALEVVKILKLIYSELFEPKGIKSSCKAVST